MFFYLHQVSNSPWEVGTTVSILLLLFSFVPLHPTARCCSCKWITGPVSTSRRPPASPLPPVLPASSRPPGWPSTPNSRPSSKCGGSWKNWGTGTKLRNNQRENRERKQTVGYVPDSQLFTSISFTHHWTLFLNIHNGYFAHPFPWLNGFLFQHHNNLLQGLSSVNLRLFCFCKHNNNLGLMSKITDLSQFISSPHQSWIHIFYCIKAFHHFFDQVVIIVIFMYLNPVRL